MNPPATTATAKKSSAVSDLDRRTSMTLSLTKASMESLGFNNRDEEVVQTVVALAAPAASTSTSFARRASRRSSRKNKNKQPQLKPAEQPFQLPPLPSSGCQPVAASADRRESWQLSTGWEDMFSSGNDSANDNSCTGSQISLYHVLDELEEESDEDMVNEDWGDVVENIDSYDNDALKSSCKKSSLQSLLSEDQELSQSGVGELPQQIGNNGEGANATFKTSTGSNGSDNGFNHSNYSLSSNNSGRSNQSQLSSSIVTRRQGPRGGKDAHLKTSIKAFRRSVQDTIRQDEDSPAFFGRSGSGCTHLTGSIISSSGLAGIIAEGEGGRGNCDNDLGHVFGDLLLD